MKAVIVRITQIVKALGRDQRGEDLTEKSSHLSNAAKVVIAATAIAATAAGTTVVANSANNASDTVSSKVNGVVGAQAGTAQQSSTPFTPH